MLKNLNIIFLSFILVYFFCSLFLFVHKHCFSKIEISSSPDKELIFHDLTLINKKLEIIKQSLSVQNKELISQDLTVVNKESNNMPTDTTSIGQLAITPAQAKFLQRGLVPIHPAQTLTIVCGTGTIKIYYLDGRVEIPEGVSLPEASRVFWEAIGNAFPEFRQAIIAKERLK